MNKAEMDTLDKAFPIGFDMPTPAACRAYAEVVRKNQKRWLDEACRPSLLAKLFGRKKSTHSGDC